MIKRHFKTLKHSGRKNLFTVMDSFDLYGFNFYCFDHFKIGSLDDWVEQCILVGQDSTGNTGTKLRG